MPPLLADADALVGGSTSGTRVAARAERSRIRVVAGSLLVHTWQFTAAERAFTLAAEDAEMQFLGNRDEVAELPEFHSADRTACR